MQTAEPRRRANPVPMLAGYDYKDVQGTGFTEILLFVCPNIQTAYVNTEAHQDAKIIRIVPFMDNSKKRCPGRDAAQAQPPKASTAPRGRKRK